MPSIRVFTGFKALAFFLFLIAGVILFFSVFFWGIAKAIQVLLPLLIIFSYFLIVVFLLGILPASYVKNLRSRLSFYSIVLSYLLGVATWMMSFFFVVKAFGLGAVFVALFFQFLAPIALGGAMIKGAWHVASNLIIWISFTFIMKFYSRWLLNLNSRTQQKKDIIDVEVMGTK